MQRIFQQQMKCPCKHGIGLTFLAVSCVQRNSVTIDPVSKVNTTQATGPTEITNDSQVHTPNSPSVVSPMLAPTTDETPAHVPGTVNLPKSETDINQKPKEQKIQERNIWLGRPVKPVTGIVNIEIAPNGFRLFIPCVTEPWEPLLIEEESAHKLRSLPWQGHPGNPSIFVFAHVKGFAQISKEGHWKGSDGQIYRFQIKFTKVTPTKESCPQAR